MSVILLSTWIQMLQSKDKAASKVQVKCRWQDSAKASAPAFFFKQLFSFSLSPFFFAFFFLCSAKLYKEWIIVFQDVVN